MFFRRSLHCQQRGDRGNLARPTSSSTTGGASAVWESTPNRFFPYASGAKDTTIHFVYFNDTKPTGGQHSSRRP